MSGTPRQIQLGGTVRWWEGGDQGRPACAALVTTGSDKQGAVGLHIFRPNAYTPLIKTGVRHRGDPYLKQWPQHAHENGVWDYVETGGIAVPSGTEIETAEAAAPAAAPGPAIPMDDRAQRDFILTRWAKKTSAAEIAKELTRLSGREWTAYEVRKVAEKKVE